MRTAYAVEGDCRLGVWALTTSAVQGSRFEKAAVDQGMEGVVEDALRGVVSRGKPLLALKVFFGGHVWKQNSTMRQGLWWLNLGVGGYDGGRGGR